MKIAFVRTASNILKYGGYNIQEIGLAKSLMPYGVSTDIYARFSNIDKITEVAQDQNGNKVIVRPLNGKQIYREIMYYPSLKYDLLNGGYDIVQLLDDSQMMLPSLFKALKKANVKTILWQGMYRDFDGKIAHTMQIVYDTLFSGILNKYSDLKIAKTEAAKDYLIGKKYKNVVVLPVGLDEVATVRDGELDKRIEAFKQNYPKLLLYIGAIEPRRNPDFLINLIEMIKDPEVGMIMIGKGISLKTTQELVRQKGLEKRVMMIESVPNKNLISVYERADVFLLPTNYEIYGMVVMEALTFGVPVISTPEAGPSYLLPNKQFGICHPLNYEEWEQAISYYFSHPSTQTDKTARLDYVNNNFRWKIIAPQYYNIIHTLINK